MNLAKRNRPREGLPGDSIAQIYGTDFIITLLGEARATTRSDEPPQGNEIFGFVNEEISMGLEISHGVREWQ